METAMKRCVLILLAVYGLMAAPLTAFAQEKKSERMRYVIDGKDTIFIETLPPAYAFPKRLRGKEGRQWRKYYQLVHNFAKAYPYALLAKEKLIEADSTIQAGNLKGRAHDRYINDFQKELFRTFEAPLKNLTISQGKLLLRLIDREVGMTSYNVVRNYKGRAAAAFWQGIAKLFGSSMKNPYDRTGEDKETEELVIIYKKGQFPALYFAIFGSPPPEPVERSREDKAIMEASFKPY